ncbi:MAG: rod-binding protein [Treponema sp.]|nr:rod-binding protein [Treponema sp.]
MDVDSLGSLYLNNQILTDGVMNRAKNAAGDISGFEETLRRTQAARAAEVQDAPESGADFSRTAKIDKTDKLYEQCVELEIFLVKTLVSSMRNTVQKSGLIDEGFAGKMYEDMLYDEYARDFAKNAGFGLADMAYLELSGQRGKQIAGNN